MLTQGMKLLVTMITLLVSLISYGETQGNLKFEYVNLSSFYDAQMLQKACKYVKDFNQQDKDETAAHYVCIGYIAGAFDATRIPSNSCLADITENIKPSEVGLLFNTFIAKNTKYLTVDAAQVLILAINDAFSSKISACLKDKHS